MPQGQITVFRLGRAFLSVAFSLVGIAYGDVFTITFGAIGVSALDVSVSRAVLVADTEGDGFLGFGDTSRRDSDVRLFDTVRGFRVDDDVILAVLDVTTTEGLLAFDSGVMAFDTDDAVWDGTISSDDSIALVILYDGGFKPGDRIGMYRSDQITDAPYGGNQAYRLPGNGADASIISVGSSLSLFGGPMGGVAESEFSALDRIALPAEYGSFLGELEFAFGGPMQVRLTSSVPGMHVVEWSPDLLVWRLLVERELDGVEPLVLEERALAPISVAKKAFVRAWRVNE